MTTRRLIPMLMLIVIGMFGFGYAMVPLYSVFCEALGIKLVDGTGRVAETDVKTSAPAEERWITVQFDSDVDAALPWDFEPSEKFMKVRLGELTAATFSAANTSSEAIVGHAVPSIAPSEASIYFSKTECFCFEQQQLDGGEAQQMPVRFVIDPELPEKIQVVTLSYRFYRSDQAAITQIKN